MRLETQHRSLGRRAAGADADERRGGPRRLRVADPADRGDAVNARRRLDEFATVASHDLGAPLLLVAGAAEELSDQLSHSDPAVLASVRAIEVGVERMQSLVDGLLEYSRASREIESPAPVDCSAVVSHTLETLAPTIAEAGATVEVGDLPVVSGYPVLLEQLFQNLISNAVKFHGDDPPEVEITCRDQPHQFVFTVSDNGIGVAPEDAGRIFEMFARSRERQNRSGSGVGLAVAARSVEHHGGRLWVESDGAGSAFRFTVPR